MFIIENQNMTNLDIFLKSVTPLYKKDIEIDFLKLKIKDVFEREYKGTLEKWVKGDTSGNFKNLLVALLQCNRSYNTNPNPNTCQADAQALFKAGEGRWGTDESTFIRNFANRSAAEMACINQCYTQLRGKSLLKAIDKEFSGDLKKLLKTIVSVSLNPAEYFATRVNYAIKGLGTKDALLIRILVTRDEIDMPQIKQEYRRLYNKDMIKDIENLFVVLMIVRIY